MEIKEILERIALPARSNKMGFQETAKLQAIEELLSQENSSYHIVEKNAHTWIFGQKDPQEEEYGILISSHADIVEGITKPFSELGEDRYFKGTYDNLGTNGACVALMMNEDLPDNVYFAFTDEEETGRCLGAQRALSYLIEKTGIEPFCIALDVTDEGYDNDRLFTLEGMNTKSGAVRERILTALVAGDGEKQSFEIVKMKKKDNVSMVPEEYVASGLTVFDESKCYAEKNCNSFSFCLPTDGSMHTNSGLYVKEPVMNGYVQSLLQTVYILNAVYPEKIEEIKAKKDAFVEDAQSIEKRKSTYSYGGYGISSYTSNYDPYWYKKYCSSTYQNEYEQEAYDAYGYRLGDENGPWFGVDNIDEQIWVECYEAVECYENTPEGLEMYFNDMRQTYRLSDDQEVYDALVEIFTDAMREREFCDLYDDDFDFD